MEVGVLQTTQMIFGGGETMEDKCDFCIQKYGDYYCTVKDNGRGGYVSYTTYQDFCKYGNRYHCTEKCPIYIQYKNK